MRLRVRWRGRSWRAGRSSRGLLLGCTVILVHSFVDVNLQIPTKAAWFCVLCVVAAPYPLETRQRVRCARSSRLRDPELEECESGEPEVEGSGSTQSV
jgi:hypothetical protein